VNLDATVLVQEAGAAKIITKAVKTGGSGDTNTIVLGVLQFILDRV
jgi:hypothetical protein